jgi:hypothetical protein
MDLRYPLGPLDLTAPFTPETRLADRQSIRELPQRIRTAVNGLTDAQLDTPYRPGGWTVRQLVHHVADSHMNGYIRLKLGLTEDHPTIKPYQQDRWVELADSRLPIAVSLSLLDGVHERWTALWETIGAPELARTFLHPELGPLTLDAQLHIYGWHSRHHVAHITELRRREGW